MSQFITERLESLQRLRADGVLSEDEFQRLKQKLISDSLKETATEKTGTVEEPRTPFFSRTIEIDAQKFGNKYFWGLLIFAGLAGIAAFPLINEGTGNECSALEGSLIRTAGQEAKGPESALAVGFATLLQRASNGALAATAIKKRYPLLPPAMGCMVGYYHVMLRRSDWEDDPVAVGSDVPTQPSSASSETTKTPPIINEASVAPQAEPLPRPTIPHRGPEKSAPADELPSIAPIETAAPRIPSFTVSDPLRPIMRTHTIPPYPPISIRLNESGTTLMEVHITTEGNVDDCKIVTSSSSERLDTAACDYVKRVWRWQPPTNQGTPTAVSTRVSVKWDLRDAQSSQDVRSE